jgi:hypothetical protein
MRHYVPELGMWRVSKLAAERLPEFFPNFETLARRPAKPVRHWWNYIPVSGTVRIAVYAVVLFLVFSAWRSGAIGATARTAVDHLPGPISRLLTNPTALAQGTNGTRPAATLTPTANMHEAPDGSSKVLGEATKGKALCVYQNENDWQGGTVEGRTETVWMYKPLLSATPPK